LTSNSTRSGNKLAAHALGCPPHLLSKVLVFTKWPEFKSLDENFLKKFMSKPLIIDGRGFLEKEKFQDGTYYKIPRPLRKQGWNQVNISDSDCVFLAFALLDVPHDSFRNNIKESKGWLIGPHLYIDDWTLTFGTGRLEYQLDINPWLLITDSPTQLAIAILRSKCIYGTPSESKQSRLALKKFLKLELLIPKEATRKRSEDINLRYYENDSIRLKYAVSFYDFVISKYWDKKGYKGRGADKKEDIGKAFELIYGIPMPEEITTGERDKAKVNTALSFISYEIGTPFPALLKKFYVTLKKEILDIKLGH